MEVKRHRRSRSDPAIPQSSFFSARDKQGKQQRRRPNHLSSAGRDRPRQDPMRPVGADLMGKYYPTSHRRQRTIGNHQKGKRVVIGEWRSLRDSMPWEVRWSNSRQRAYFYNDAQSLSIWEPPTGLSEDDIVNLPGARENLHRQPQAPEQVQASHLLIKHAGSRRPSSWKETNITRSKEEAIAALRAHQAELNKAQPADLPRAFAQLASTESHCSSHSHGGDLGPFRKGQMQKPFEDATFGLRVGQMSDIVETDSGVHLILRTA
ncbi:peptidyl-prolyl cis-trans isomerase Pin1 [Cystobasidiomycetes sp. EMM_F5]